MSIPNTGNTEYWHLSRGSRHCLPLGRNQRAVPSTFPTVTWPRASVNHGRGQKIARHSSRTYVVLHPPVLAPVRRLMLFLRRRNGSIRAMRVTQQRKNGTATFHRPPSPAVSATSAGAGHGTVRTWSVRVRSAASAAAAAVPSRPATSNRSSVSLKASTYAYFE